MNQMSKNAFAALVSFWTVAGLGSSAAAAYVSQAWKLNWVFLLGVTVVALLGVVVAMASENPLISLIGYSMVSVPFGLMLGPIVAAYTVASVFKVLFITTLIVVVLGVVGAIIPDSLESWGIYLFGGLLILLFGQFGIMIGAWMGFPIKGVMTIWDWLGVLLFSAYVIFDMNRAMRVPRTLDNSIDCALAIYLDFVNIFIRLLSLLGQKKD